MSPSRGVVTESHEEGIEEQTGLVCGHKNLPASESSKRSQTYSVRVRPRPQYLL
jgi:hypothetical protein